MERTALEIYLGKWIKIVRTDGFYFSGRIETLNSDSLLFRDKYNKPITIAFAGIASVQEVPRND